MPSTKWSSRNNSFWWSHMQGPTEGHLCGRCCLQLERTTNVSARKRVNVTSPGGHVTPRFSAKRRRLVTSTPKARAPRARWHKTTGGIVASITSSVTNAHYARAFRHLLTIGPAARRAFNAVVRQTVRRQINSYARIGRPACLGGRESVSDFSWQESLADYSQSMPTLYAALCGAMPAKLFQDTEELT